MLNSAGHEICPAYKSRITNNCISVLLNITEHGFFLLINMKMLTVVGIFIFISREKFMHS